MKIGLVIYGSLDLLSGGYLYDRRLVENLTVLGEEVHILPLPWRAYPLCLTDNSSAAVRGKLLSQAWDVLLEDELTHPSLFYLNKILHARGHFPIIAIVHHLRSNEKHPPGWSALYRAVERRYLNSLDGLICNSHATWQAVEKFTCRRLPAVIAHPAADHFTLDERAGQALPAVEAPALRILFVGNLIPRKGLGVLIDALATMREQNWSLTVAGSLDFDPPYARRMVETARRRLPQKQVIFTGRVSDEALLDLYGGHDVLAVPSMYEGFGIVYLEAMRLGLVPVGSTGGGAGEIITHGRDGYLIAPGDARGLTQILGDLLSQPEKLIEMKKNARLRALTFPSWQENALNVRNFLADSVRSHSAVKSD